VFLEHTYGEPIWTWLALSTLAKRANSSWNRKVIGTCSGYRILRFGNGS
jgi:hypothetical protein